MNPYYEADGITIYHADMRDVVPSIAFECIVTDPPYGETSLAWDRWLDGWPACLLGESRQMWCFGSMRVFLSRIGEFAGWKFAQDIVWEKHNGSGFHADRFKRVHEHALQFYTGEWAGLHHKPVFTPDATARTVRRKHMPPHLGDIGAGAFKSYDGGPRLMRSVIYARSCHGSADHETQKPLDILGPLIEYSCPAGGLVVDPFMGAGTTALVSARHSRNFIGCELNQKYIDIAEKRILPELAQGKMF